MSDRVVRADPSSSDRAPATDGDGGNGDARRPDNATRQHMEIGGPGRSRRVVGFLTYALLFLGVSAVLVTLFVRFTGNLRLAIGLVIFMVSYMLVMGWWASRGNGSGHSQ
jgi:hypothetical protein